MRIVRIVVGILIFALAMGIREEFSGMWLRAAIAAVGGAGLALMLTAALARGHRPAGNQ